jgi:hypothetical protein
MNNIDYKQEVLKCLPFAKCLSEPSETRENDYYFMNLYRMPDVFATEEECWMDAYENLKKEGRIL